MSPCHQKSLQSSYAEIAKGTIEDNYREYAIFTIVIIFIALRIFQRNYNDASIFPTCGDFTRNFIERCVY